MKWFRADLHIHSVLSPCGDLDMSPARIIEEAEKQKLDIIGISDHNSTLHAEVMIELGKKKGITVFPGVEVNTREEIHCLTFFENIEYTKRFQEFLENNMPGIKNNAEKFGHQLVVNEKEEILDEVQDFLIAGIMASIDEVEKEAHRLNGVFIPAHVDRQMNGIFAQIGFLPPDLPIDAIEISSRVSQEEMLQKKDELKSHQLITNSDAHYPNQIGTAYTDYYMEAPTFIEWVKTLKREGDRKIRIKS